MKTNYRHCIYLLSKIFSMTKVKYESFKQYQQQSTILLVYNKVEKRIVLLSYLVNFKDMQIIPICITHGLVKRKSVDCLLTIYEIRSIVFRNSYVRELFRYFLDKTK